MTATSSNSSTKGLLAPYTLGDLELKNRIVMAPLTRTRAANEGKAPNELMAQYYAQRAGAGLIITEGSLSASKDKAGTEPRESTPKNSAPDGSELPTPFMAQAD